MDGAVVGVLEAANKLQGGDFGDIDAGILEMCAMHLRIARHKEHLDGRMQGEQRERRARREMECVSESVYMSDVGLLCVRAETIGMD